MCIICIDLQKGVLLPREALRNLDEMVRGQAVSEEHAEEVEDLVDQILEDRYTRRCSSVGRALPS